MSDERISTEVGQDQEQGDSVDRPSASLAIAKAAEALWQSGRLDPLLEDQPSPDYCAEAIEMVDLLFKYRPKGWFQ